MATSESKGRFFLQNESIRITNGIESIRIANWNALLCCVCGIQPKRARAALVCFTCTPRFSAIPRGCGLQLQTCFTKGSPYSITERMVPELIPVLGSQPAGAVSHKPGIGCHYSPQGLQLPPQPLRMLRPVLLLGEQRHDGCEQFA